MDGDAKGERETQGKEARTCNEERVWTCPFKDCGSCYRQKDTIKLNAMIRNHFVNRPYEEATEKVKTT